METVEGKKIGVILACVPRVTCEPSMSAYRKTNVAENLKIRTHSLSEGLYRVIQGDKALAIEGYPDNHMGSSWVCFRPDRIETYDGTAEHCVYHFPKEDERYWGIKEILTEFFIFISLNNMDIIGKAISYTNALTDFHWENKDKQVRYSSLFTDLTGFYFGHMYTMERTRDVAIIEDKNSYDFDINSHIPINNIVPEKHFIVRIIN